MSLRKCFEKHWLGYDNCNCKILEVASYSNLNNYRGSAVRDIRTPLGVLFCDSGASGFKGTR